MPTGCFRTQSFILGEICAFVEAEILYSRRWGGQQVKSSQRELKERKPMKFEAFILESFCTASF